LDGAAPPATAVYRSVSSAVDHVAETPGLASLAAAAAAAGDDRNMFQRYDFRFNSIGDFGRGDVATPTAETASGSEQVRSTGSAGCTAPVAVFRFQDFDDMVARMRDQSASRTSG